MRARRSRLLAFVVGLTLTGCHDAAPPSAPRQFPRPVRRTDDVAATEAQPIWSRQVQGVDEAGGQYMLLYPTAPWTGRLVLIVHGLVDPRSPISLGPITPGEDLLGSRGDAVARSSFSENGWAVKDGAQRIHELVDLFTAQFGAPSRVYLYGQSMGSLIAIKLAESFPTQYDGVVAECGILGGSLARFRYMFDVRSLFDFFYPGVLPGGTLWFPEDVKPGTVRTLALTAMQASPAAMDGARQIAKVVQAPVAFDGDEELRNAIADQLFRHAREVNDIIARGHGEPAVGNRDVVYAARVPGDVPAATLAAINASVPRYDAGRYAAHYYEQYYEPTGKLRVPVVTLYQPHDPALPAVLSEELYQKRVDAAGASAYFTRMPASVDYGHCTGTLDDRSAAYQLLLQQVEGTSAPSGS
jgi:pimeloyl-ACP methyl ester carboxylesterase